jgi:hypothetical protein
MKQGVTFPLQTLHTNFFYAGIQASKRWWDNAEMLVAKVWKSVYHPILIHHQVRIKFSASQCSLSSSLTLCRP